MMKLPKDGFLIGGKRFFTSGRYVDYTFVLPALLFVFIFMLYPICYNILMSFKDITIQNLVQGAQDFIGLENYRSIWKDKYFWGAFKNTFLFLFFCLSFQFGIGFFFALFFNKRFYGHKWMRAVLLVAWMNPIIITGTIFKWLMAGDAGILNYLLTSLHFTAQPVDFLVSVKTALGSVIFANVWIGVPFNMVILLSGLQSIPEDMYESAVVDGAGPIQKFFYITLPMLRPTVLVLLILGFVYTFKVFDIIYAMTGGGPANASQILPYYSYELSFKSFRFGEGAAVSCVSFLLIGVFAGIYVYLSKREEAL